MKVGPVGTERNEAGPWDGDGSGVMVRDRAAACVEPAAMGAIRRRVPGRPVKAAASKS